MNFVPKRTNALQLPEIKELQEIFNKEAKRPIPWGKEKIHFASFELFKQWLSMVSISSDALFSKTSWKELAILGAQIQSEVVTKTLKLAHSGDKNFEELMKRITNYLGEEDEPQPSDTIFVFGSKNMNRIETAVNLYKKGLASHIFISGGSPIYEEEDESEAQIFQNWALEHGVSSEAIAIHDGAISVADNVRGGLNIMDSLGMQHNSLILVITWFAMRRAWTHMKKYVDEGTVLYRVAAPVSANGSFAPDLWYKNEVGIKTVFNEFGKMRISELLNSS